jgi:hypothetical protein
MRDFIAEVTTAAAIMVNGQARYCRLQRGVGTIPEDHAVAT